MKTRPTANPRPPAPALFGVILAGGRGTRFWPRSRRTRAKQVLAVVGQRTLIQQTVLRLRPLIPPERLWIITSSYLRSEILRQLPGVPPAQVIAEPAQRNTAPAIGLAAHLIRREAPDAVMGVFPADHVVARQDQFLRVIRMAVKGAAAGPLVVLGIRPRWPETGYGYIQFAKRPALGSTPRLYPVSRFREKPDRATARRYVKSGKHFWNSGMFFWRADTILGALGRYLPATAAVLKEIANGVPIENLYPRCENISIDYAVLEKAGNVLGIPCEIGWSDVGSWNAVYELLPHDAARNATRGPVWALDATGNYLDATGKLVAAIGVEDLIVVDTPDALLIARRDRAQDVSEVVKWLEKRKREDLL